ncbi:MAG: MBL fold metallo-hydrolase, partial [Deltaproteobacteria bacterium]|nr:MBL fold metallo-hydrolase [Deltaproteobacteria bacterium]
MNQYSRGCHAFGTNRHWSSPGGYILKKLSLIFLLGLAAVFSACEKKVPYDPDADAQGHTAPTALTAELNAEVLKELPFSDKQDFKECQRGFIAGDPDLRVMDSRGDIIWNQPAYGFIKNEAPSSVNPSLWRQAKLNNVHGLFKVAEGVYQVRGFCLSNMSIIEGKTGWIIVDPLTTKETASRAIAFARKHLKNRPIVAVIFTHSHIDHFGGVHGVLSPEEAAGNKVDIITPRGFMEEATSENIIAGIAMA